MEVCVCVCEREREAGAGVVYHPKCRKGRQAEVSSGERRETSSLLGFG
jgi:hypothetical protein